MNIDNSLVDATWEKIKSCTSDIEKPRDWHYVLGLIDAARSLGVITEVQRCVLIHEADRMASEMFTADDLDVEELMMIFTDR